MSSSIELTPHIAHASAPLIGDLNVFIERTGGWPRMGVVLAFVLYMVVAIITCIRTARAAALHSDQTRTTIALIPYFKD